MSSNNSNKFDDLYILTEQIVKSVMSDMSLLTEGEREQQKETEKLLKDDSAIGEKKEEVNEDEDEDKGSDKKVVVPRTGSTESGEEKDPAANADIPQPSVSEFTDAKLSDVIDQINMLRSGKSLKDKEIQGQLSTYYNRLKAGERQVFMIFMSALSQILSGDIGGGSAPSPKGLDIEIVPKEKKDNREEENDQEKAPQGTVIVGGI